jgi:hypothetical protein
MASPQPAFDTFVKRAAFRLTLANGLPNGASSSGGAIRSLKSLVPDSVVIRDSIAQKTSGGALFFVAHR